MLLTITKIKAAMNHMGRYFNTNTKQICVIKLSQHMSKDILDMNNQSWNEVGVVWYWLWWRQIGSGFGIAAGLLVDCQDGHHGIER